MTKSPCGNVHSAPSHNLYGTHENSIPFLHRDLAAAYFTSLSLLNRETCQMFRCLSLKGHTTVGVYITGIHLTNVHLVGGGLIGVHLMGVNLMGGCFMGVHLMGASHRVCISRACIS
jgi:uncharacterized protein YjbI with pentapeptide repeats